MLAALVAPADSHAQRSWRAIAGAGTFLTRDVRGWNYDLNLSGNVGAAWTLSSALSLRTLASVRVGKFGQGQVPVIPPPPTSIANGVTVGAHLLSTPGPLGLYVLGGVDYFRPWLEERAHEGTFAGAVGAGFALGRQHQWILEGRYSRFARAVSATRGHLDIALLRVF